MHVRCHENGSMLRSTPWTNEGMVRGFCFCYLRQFQAASFAVSAISRALIFAVTGNRFPPSEWNRIS
jgi:hypothetical protein